MFEIPLFRRWRAPLAASLALLLAACGGGGDDAGGGSQPASCNLVDQKDWLGSYMNDAYFWYRLSPQPDPRPYASTATYFDALLYTGTDPVFPADRWSRIESTESFNLFFGNGATLGYGVSVAGSELDGDGTRPLYVRYVEPNSPAALAGVSRGDQVLTANGQNPAQLIANGFSALSASQRGETLSLRLRRAGVDRTVTLTAADFNLSPVTGATWLLTTGGRLIGYLNVKDMISQAGAPLETAFAQFKAARIDDLALDLRYNGGGLVSTGGVLASYIAGLRGTGRSYAKLLYNDKNAARNTAFAFSNPTSSLGLPRVFVLMGRRTCSASEQVINGLRGLRDQGFEVIAIGETSCGKPVGFNPVSACGNTFNVVNFESVNDRNEGRYFDGFGPTCPVAEDFTVVQGSWDDPLMDAAGRYADNGACPVASTRAQPLAVRAARRSAILEPGERQGMLGR
ncbi:Peptidase S41 [Rubrivivax sp. A210]|uniref:S41 family peptidase n=1 Tax=Rubrivivax sp. A210 TaxID=2772301 RepID=UPI00191A4317|nr:S41 family peptidase [Rubrivivax sp. A210]CAD5373774.1 Peptidase S41 [Rubrivivax sp. A210]